MPTLTKTLVDPTPQTTTATMTAVRKPRAEAGFEVTQVQKPVPGPGEALIKVKYASICGTDLHITNWDSWSASRIKPPLTYGHEFCGYVVEVADGVTTVLPGDYVSAEMHMTCGHCYQCQTGQGHICQTVKIGGIDMDGCYAEFIKLPASQLVKVPESIPPEHAACLDALGNAVHTVEKGHVGGKIVLVTGCGPVGLFAVSVAQAMGASRVFASDVVPFRLEMAEKAGATQVLDASKVKVSEEIHRLTNGHGVDVVLEMSGNERALTDAFAALRPGGRMVLLGIPPNPVTVDLNRDVIFKGIDIVGINGREIFATWHRMLELLASGKLDISYIVTHRFALKDFGEAITLVGSGNTGKVLLAP